MIEKLKAALAALDELARLGNGGIFGNSIGNTIARRALPDLKAVIAEMEAGEPVAWRYTFKTKVVRLEQRRLDFYHWEDTDWLKGEPLFTHPQPKDEPVVKIQMNFCTCWDETAKRYCARKGTCTTAIAAQFAQPKAEPDTSKAFSNWWCVCAESPTYQETFAAGWSAAIAQPKAEPCEAGAMCLQCPDRDANEDYKRGFQDGLAELGDVMAENHCTECGTRMVDKCDVCKPKADPVQEPVKYLLDGRRFKIHLNERMDVGCFWNFPELEGRWVALVAAEDDCHLAAAPQSATVQRELLEALRVAEDAVGDLNALEIVRAAIAKVESGAAPQATIRESLTVEPVQELPDEWPSDFATFYRDLPGMKPEAVWPFWNAFYAAAPQAKALTWQPIETAPVATGILAVWRPVDHAERPHHREVVIGVRCFDMNTYKPNGKFYSNGRYYDEATHVTHWMPLSEAPAHSITTHLPADVEGGGV